MFGNSKRIFDVSRLKSFAGYTDGPILQDRLDYFIPPFHVISSRLVAFGKRLFELWSPNSTQTPFYPGVQDPNFKAGLEIPPSQRRCDGHIGRFDPTISPQHYNPNYLWLHLVRRWERDSLSSIRLCVSYRVGSISHSYPSTSMCSSAFILRR